MNSVEKNFGTQKPDQEVVELFKLGIDKEKWEEFCQKFRGVFADRLMERNTEPKNINYLNQQDLEMIDNGELLNFENKMLQEEFIKLAQDVRLLPDQVDHLKLKFFTQESIDSWNKSK